MLPVTDVVVLSVRCHKEPHPVLVLTEIGFITTPNSGTEEMAVTFLSD